ncbi:MAG: hypothetical protein DMG61_10005 [Acidobacteria bacterium]|nr:MAG: hypothetical protein DMG61_10005 [Acidobacteriota bacterium]
MSTDRQHGFSLLEMMIVVVIILVMAGLMAPKMLAVIDDQKVRANAQAYAGLLQLARSRATQDNATYQVLTTTTNGVPVAYVDLHKPDADDGNRTYEPLGSTSNGNNPEPAVLLAAPITIGDTGVPAGFGDNTLLGMQPFSDSTSPMVQAERGLPCQRVDKALTCQNAPLISGTKTPIAYVTYLQYATRAGGTAYAAVTVTPAGRIKTWIYQGGNWQ